MKITKEISFAFPTSKLAENLGFKETGCFHISLTYHNIENSDQSISFVPHNAEGFLNPDDPDLIAIFKETEGETCRHFIKYGNGKALKALGYRK
jgi:hypothetical protein